MPRQILVTIGDGRTSIAPPIARTVADTLGLSDTATGSLTSTVRFPGDPGVNKMHLGATHNGYSNDWFDQRLFGSTPTKRCKLDRVYNDPPASFVISSGSKTKLQSNAAAGRISVFSSKGISDGGTGGPYSVAHIAAGNTDSDADIDANATFMASVAGSIYYAFYHEPENLNSPLDPTLMDNYRAAARRIISRTRAIASNVAFCSPFFTSDNWNPAHRNTADDPRWFHPNYTGDPRTQGTTGGGHWLTNGPFSGSWVNLDGIDYYNPTVPTTTKPFTSSTHNQTFMDKFQNFLDRRAADAWYDLPTVIGEGGFYNYLSTLTGGTPSVSNADQFNDMITNGTAAGLVGCVMWNYSRGAYDNAYDLYDATGHNVVGAKSAALAAAITAHPTRVVMG